MKNPTFIKIICKADGRPTAGLLVLITLKTRRKNDFSSVVGPSSNTGEITVDWALLESNAQHDREFFLMDYTSLADFTGEIVVRAFNRSHIDRSLAAYETYRGHLPMRPDLPEQLRILRTTLDRLEPATISVDVEHDGEDIVVIAESVEA